jgi:uncharacterized protein YraI
MMVRRSLAIAAVCFGLIVSVPAIAHAYTLFTTGALNVRLGPGVQFAKIGALTYGTPVDVQFCQPGWCRIGYWGGTGWVSARYLSAVPQQRRYVRRYQPAPGIYFRFDFGSPPPNPWPNPWPPYPWPPSPYSGGTNPFPPYSTWR